MIAAAHAHQSLRVPRDDYVDVFAALKAANVEVVARKLGPLLGFYLASGDGGPACLLNEGLVETDIRHTLAHELGHHVLGHGTTLDHDGDRRWGRWGEDWPEHEKAAEAFASWFLMPLPAVRAACARVGVRHPSSPADVYRIARWLGTPYATTVRHLVRLKAIGRSTERMWVKNAPADLKNLLAHGLGISPRAHVHALGRGAHDAHIRVAAGDLLLLDFSGAWDAIPPGFANEDPSDQTQLSWEGGPDGNRALWVTEELNGVSTLTATSGDEIFHVTVSPVPRRHGSDHFWES
ncbi:ImmA/IrrE family metallo-endopeptidase [Embleya sp. MST-111070]|uniref:ImmA/IrrE family metallo-endopeptidase n=1 Tax=Embleya sp. MST-111070 TaxID=3398231 RepID=UPI003F73D896